MPAGVDAWLLGPAAPGGVDVVTCRDASDMLPAAQQGGTRDCCVCVWGRGVPLQLSPRVWAWGRGLLFGCKPLLDHQETSCFIDC